MPEGAELYSYTPQGVIIVVVIIVEIAQTATGVVVVKISICNCADFNFFNYLLQTYDFYQNLKIFLEKRTLRRKS